MPLCKDYIALVLLIKGMHVWVDIVNIYDKRENRAYDAKIPYSKKSFGYTFVNYLGPSYFNSLPISIQISIYANSIGILKNVLLTG